MKFLKALSLSLLLTTAVASSAVAAGPNLLVNPGFEDAGGSYNGYFTFGNGPNISTAANDNMVVNAGISPTKTAKANDAQKAAAELLCQRRRSLSR